MVDEKKKRSHDEERETRRKAKESGVESKQAREGEERSEPLSETTFSDESELYAFTEETSMNFVGERAEASDDAVMDEIARYTDDPDVLEDFAERQGLDAGSERLFERLTQHHSKSPNLSAEDVDAAWEYADLSGEESVGGSVPTPDQDIVEEIGEALGLEYNDDEPLNTFDKLSRRDADRYELDPQSMLDMAGELVPPEDTPYGEEIEELEQFARLEGAELEEGRAGLPVTGREGATLSEADSLDEDMDVLGDASFPQKASDENTDEEYL
jgi:hypothetical protein